MIVAKTRMALFFVVVLGIAGLCVLAVCHQSAEPREIFRLGGFNVLCLDGLVQNLPLDAEDSGVKSEECKVKNGGRANLVGVARLVPQPAPALVREGGERKQDDLLPNFSEMKG